MRFARLETLIKNAEDHLDSTGSRQSDIETYLVQYLLVRVWAEYEARLRTMVERRCGRVKDTYIKRFVARSVKETMRHFKISDIKGVLGGLGEDYKNEFDIKVKNTLAHTAWDNLYANRMSVAHGHGSVQMTLSDLRHDYCESTDVFDALATVLVLRAKELKDLV